MSEKEVNELLDKFKAGRTGAMLLNLDGRSYYLVYEKSDIQDWMFLGLVQADIVNDSMNSLQRSTILLVSAVVLCIAAFFISLVIQKSRINLKKKDTEILYRDELFQKLSMNVDDVFLMLDAKHTMQIMLVRMWKTCLALRWNRFVKILVFWVNCIRQNRESQRKIIWKKSRLMNRENGILNMFI